MATLVLTTCEFFCLFDAQQFIITSLNNNNTKTNLNDINMLRTHIFMF